MEAIFIRVPGVQSRANRAREGQTNAGLRSKERIGDVHIRSAAILRAAFFRFFGFFFFSRPRFILFYSGSFCRRRPACLSLRSGSFLRRVCVCIHNS